MHFLKGVCVCHILVGNNHEGHHRPIPDARARPKQKQQQQQRRRQQQQQEAVCFVIRGDCQLRSTGVQSWLSENMWRITGYCLSQSCSRFDDIFHLGPFQNLLLDRRIFSTAHQGDRKTYALVI